MISIMLHIPKVDDYLKTLNVDEVKDIVAINFSKQFKSTKEKLHSKLNEQQNLRRVAKSIYVILAKPDEVEKYAQIM